MSAPSSSTAAVGTGHQRDRVDQPVPVTLARREHACDRQRSQERVPERAFPLRPGHPVGQVDGHDHERDGRVGEEAILGGLLEHPRQLLRRPAAAERAAEELADPLLVERPAKPPVDLLRVVAERQMGRDEAADAAPPGVVDGVARLLEHLQHAHVRVAFRAAGA